MTLQQLYDYLSTHALFTSAFLLFPVAMAFFVGQAGRGKGFESPWREVYAVLVYWTAIPGIFAFTLLTYLFLFERHSVLELDIVTQFLPIIAMVVTLLLIQRNVDLAYVPGFGRLRGLMLIIAVLLVFMYLAQRFHWITFTYLPAGAVIIGFVLLVILLAWGSRRAFGRRPPLQS